MLTIRSPVARRRVAQHLRVGTVAGERWRDKLPCKQVLQGLSQSDIQDQDHRTLGYAALYPDFHAISGPWQLGRWKTSQQVRSTVLASWQSWTQQLRLHPRLHRSGRGFWKSFFKDFNAPTQPARWQLLEAPFRDAVESGK
eukprot:5117005-Pyramimonas_sp.AAC.1